MELLAMAHSINFVRYTNVQLFSPLEGDCLLKLWSSISLNFSYFWRISIWINFFCRIFLGILYLLQSTSLSLPWEIAHAYFQNPKKILPKKFVHIEILGKRCSKSNATLGPLFNFLVFSARWYSIRDRKKLLWIVQFWPSNYIERNRLTHFYRNYFHADSECPQTEFW